MPPVDHECSLLGVVVELSNQIEKMKHELAQLKKAHIGPKSERSKMPRVPTKPVTADERLAKRRTQAADRAQTQTVRTEHKVPLEERTCPSCGNENLKPIRYALNQWSELGRFLDDARVPLDNNASERSLRRVALGRKNHLFVGDVEAGTSIAGLYTLVATCETRGINPFAYLADVIPRVQDHPKRRLDELLPGPWARAHTNA